MSWEQKGFLVVSNAKGLPLFHGFYLPEWEANKQLDHVKTLPEELRVDACVVPARVWFDYQAAQNTRGAQS